MVDRETIVNAIIGAVASVVLSFVPFSTVLGGAIAGYLEGPNRSEGMKAGALAGGILTLLSVAFGFLFFLFMLLGIAGEGGFGGLFILLFFGFFGVLMLVIYTVGLGALGGYLGAYLAPEYPDPRDSVRDVLEPAYGSSTGGSTTVDAGRPDGTTVDRTEDATPVAEDDASASTSTSTSPAPSTDDEDATEDGFGN